MYDLMWRDKRRERMERPDSQVVQVAALWRHRPDAERAVVSMGTASQLASTSMTLLYGI